MANNPELMEDLYVTGSHALLYNNLSDDEFEKMENLIKHYNTYNITFDGSESENMDEEQKENMRNMIKYYNDYSLMIENKYKLIAYFNSDFEEVSDNSVANIYHIVLENTNKYGNYGIYVNGVLAESTCEVSLTRFPGYEKINFTPIKSTVSKKGVDINAKLNKYKEEKLRLKETFDKVEDIIVKQIENGGNRTYKRTSVYKKNITYKKC